MDQNQTLPDKLISAAITIKGPAILKKRIMLVSRILEMELGNKEVSASIINGIHKEEKTITKKLGPNVFSTVLKEVQQSMYKKPLKVVKVTPTEDFGKYILETPKIIKPLAMEIKD